MVVRRSRSRRRRLGHASMEDGAAPNALSKCGDEEKGRSLFSLPPKKKKRKKSESLGLGFSRLGFRFVCVFWFWFFPWIFFFRSFVENPLSSRHILDLLRKQLDACRARTTRGRRRLSSEFLFCFVSCERRRRRQEDKKKSAADTFFVVVVFIHTRTHL